MNMYSSFGNEIMLKMLNVARRLIATSKEVAAAQSVNGPYLGYFIGAYSLRGDNGFVAYAKVFRERPGNPWDGFAIAKYTAFSACGITALRLAHLRAVNAISRRQPA